MRTIIVVVSLLGACAAHGVDVDPLDVDPPAPPPPPTLENALSCNAGLGVLGSVPLPAAGPAMQLYALPTGVFPTALCNDGSPAILYFRPGSGAGVDHWLIELEGGGGCRTAQDCADRWCSAGTNFGRELMGSRDYSTTRPTIAATGIQSITTGPYFDYNHVFIHYCSSDGWAGTAPSAVGSGNDPITGAAVTFSTRFNGNAILAAAIRVLRRDGATLPPFMATGVSMPDLDNATGNVVIAGGSAGGAGVIAQLDRTVYGLVANHNPARQLPFYSGMIDSAFGPTLATLGFQFTEPCMTQGQCSWQQYIEATEPYYTRLSDASCTLMHAGATAFECVDLSHVVRNHITTPIFLRQGERDKLLSDTYQNDQALAVSSASANPMAVLEFSSLVRQQAEGVSLWGATAEEPPTMTPGVFVPDCATHDPLHDNAAMFGTQIGTTAWQGTWSNWRVGTLPSRLVSDPTIPNTVSICSCRSGINC